MQFFQTDLYQAKQPSAALIKIAMSYDIEESSVYDFISYIKKNRAGEILQIPCSYQRVRQPDSTISFIWTDTDTGKSYSIDTKCSSLKIEILEKFFWPLKEQIERVTKGFCDFSVYDNATQKTLRSDLFVCGMIICPKELRPCAEYKKLQKILWDNANRHLPYNLGLPGYVHLEFNSILNPGLLPELIMFKPVLCQAILNFIEGLDMKYFVISQKGNRLFIEYSKKNVPFSVEFDLNDY